MFKEELKNRTKELALNTIRLVAQLPSQQEFWIIGKQLIRSSSSVAANYRSACIAKSTKDFVFKLSIVEEESDESVFWFEMLESLLKNDEKISNLKNEMKQILAIIITAKKTIKTNSAYKN